MTKTLKILVAVLLVFGSISTIGLTGNQKVTAAGEPVTVELDWQGNNQTIDGFGASGSFRMANNLKNWSTDEKQQYILDMLYSQDKGIGLSWVRNIVGDGGLKADGTQWGQIHDGPNPTFWPSESEECWDESCGFWDDQIWLMDEAKERGVTNYMSSVWSPPAWMKENNSVINGGHLKAEHYQDFADYIVKYLQGYKNRFGIEISAISPANEPNTVVGYSSSEWTEEELYNFIKKYLIPTFKEQNIGTAIILPEEEDFSEEFALPLLNDSETSAELPIVAVHDYHRNSAPLPTANLLGKKTWMTEMFPGQGQARDITMKSGLEWAKYVHKYLTETNASLVNYWWILNRNSDSNSGLIHLNLEDNESYILSKRLFAFGNYSKFIRPGDIRMDATAKPVPGVYTSAFKNPNSGEFSVVLVNENDTEKELEMSLNNFTAQEVVPFITDATRDLEEGDAIQLANGKFSGTLPENSVVTLTGVSDRVDFEKHAEYRIVNEESGKVLEVKKKQNKDGANIGVESSNKGRKTQRWNLAAVEEGFYTISNVKSEKVIEVDGESILQGANIQQNRYEGEKGQEWALESLGDGLFRIVNRYSGKIIEQQQGSTNVVQGSYATEESQQWRIEKVK